MKQAQRRLDGLGPYPFARLKNLLAGCEAPEQLAPIDAGAGEPRLPLPDFVAAMLAEHLDGFTAYPPTVGCSFLRQAIAGWLQRRYGLSRIDAEQQILSANGTREALFAVAHALVDPEAARRPFVLMPNPMYQIYLGAAITAGAQPYFLPCNESSGFAPDISGVPEKVWDNTAFVYVCSPSNPTGWVAGADYYRELLLLAERHDFVICADECYSEIYWQEPPTGLLAVAAAMGNTDFKRCLVFNSLSKRSALPGLRSGFIAGDAELIQRFAKLRSYTGPATPTPLQHVAAAAWSDEGHVERHRRNFVASIDAFFSIHTDIRRPEATFFVWLPVTDDEAFAAAAFTEQAITLLPGRYLGATDAKGNNPGAGYVRIALVDGADKAAELARRLVDLADKP